MRFAVPSALTMYKSISQLVRSVDSYIYACPVILTLLMPLPILTPPEDSVSAVPYWRAADVRLRYTGASYVPSAVGVNFAARTAWMCVVCACLCSRPLTSATAALSVATSSAAGTWDSLDSASRRADQSSLCSIPAVLWAPCTLTSNFAVVMTLPSVVDSRISTWLVPKMSMLLFIVSWTLPSITWAVINAFVPFGRIMTALASASAGSAYSAPLSRRLISTTRPASSSALALTVT